MGLNDADVEQAHAEALAEYREKVLLEEAFVDGLYAGIEVGAKWEQEKHACEHGTPRCDCAYCA